MSKRVWAVLSSLVLLLGVTGCKPDIEQVKEDAEFTRVCESGGGKVYYDDTLFRGIHCSFEKR